MLVQQEKPAIKSPKKRILWVPIQGILNNTVNTIFNAFFLTYYITGLL